MSIFRTLFKPKADLPSKLFIEGCKLGDCDVIENFINMENVSANTCEDGVSALQYAVRSKNPFAVKLLLYYDADVNFYNGNHTPLTDACYGHNFEIAKILLEHGADPDKVGGYNWFPILWVCCNGNIRIFELLIKHKAEISLLDTKRNNALAFTCVNGNYKIAKRLVELGIDINERNAYGETILMIAAREGSIGIVRLVLEHNDVNAVSKEGNTAIVYASIAGHLNIVKLLIENGAILVNERSWKSSFGICPQDPLVTIVHESDSIIVNFVLRYVNRDQIKELLKLKMIPKRSMSIIKKYL